MTTQTITPEQLGRMLSDAKKIDCADCDSRLRAICLPNYESDEWESACELFHGWMKAVNRDEA